MNTPPWAAVPIHETGEELVDVAHYGFAADPRYFKAGLSPESAVLMRVGALERLLAAAELVKPLRIKIWDAWRPRSVQKKLYTDLFEKTRRAHPEWSDDEVEGETQKYVNEGADLSLIPPHATGGTADLTLIGENGDELDMGTGFDHFGAEAAPFYFDEIEAAPHIAENRKILRDAMLAAGFIPWPHEWWHYEYGTQNWAQVTGKRAAIYGEARPTASVRDLS